MTRRLDRELSPCHLGCVFWTTFGVPSRRKLVFLVPFSLDLLNLVIEINLLIIMGYSVDKLGEINPSLAIKLLLILIVVRTSF